MAHELDNVKLQIKVTFTNEGPVLESRAHYQTHTVGSAEYTKGGSLDTLSLVQANINNLRPLYQAILGAIETQENVAESESQTI